MFSDMDTEAFLAFAKAHQRAILQQAAMDALGRSGVVRRRGQMLTRQRYSRWLHVMRQCARACTLRCSTLQQARVLVAQAWTNEELSWESTTSRGVRACRAVE